MSSLRSNLSDYQIAYAQLYATATGGELNVAINAATTVDELNRRITGSQEVVVTQTDEVYTDVNVDADELTIL